MKILEAMAKAREAGVKVGSLRLITAWPFPEKRIKELAGKVSAMILPEMNLGQMYLELERCAGGQCRTELIGHAGGEVFDPEVIYKVIMEVAK